MIGVIVGFVGTVAMLAAVVATYYAVSCVFLYLTFRVLPLTGRRRR